MRIVIDFQGAQSASRNRGIGRYCNSFVRSLIINASNHEIILVLSRLFPETLDSIYDEFKPLMPDGQIHVWDAPSPVNSSDPANEERFKVAKLIRENYFAALLPDIVLITSLFEGFIDDAVLSVPIASYKQVAILYDLIPFVCSDVYLVDKCYKKFYENKVNELQKTDALLAISESSKSEVVKHLGYKKDDVAVIMAGVDAIFKPIEVGIEKENSLKLKYGILGRFILCVPGGFDQRKNLATLFLAFAKLPEELRNQYQLVIIGGADVAQLSLCHVLAAKARLPKSQYVLTGHIPDRELLLFYNLAELFVFPSLHEGLGFPVLEAMACGLIVIASDTKSIPEVLGVQQALFDPTSVSSMADKIQQAMTDTNFRLEIKAALKKQSLLYSWDSCVQKALKALEQLMNKSVCTEASVFRGILSLKACKANLMRLKYIMKLLLQKLIAMLYVVVRSIPMLEVLLRKLLNRMPFVKNKVKSIYYRPSFQFQNDAYTKKLIGILYVVVRSIPMLEVLLRKLLNRMPFVKNKLKSIYGRPSFQFQNDAHNKELKMSPAAQMVYKRLNSCSNKEE